LKSSYLTIGARFVKKRREEPGKYHPMISIWSKFLKPAIFLNTLGRRTPTLLVQGRGVGSKV